MQMPNLWKLSMTFLHSAYQPVSLLRYFFISMIGGSFITGACTALSVGCVISLSNLFVETMSGAYVTG